MARFIFRFDEGSETAVDVESIAEAKCEAVRFAGRLICDSAERFWDAAGFQLEVTDEDGLLLFTLQMIGTEAPAIRKTSR